MGQGRPSEAAETWAIDANPWPIRRLGINHNTPTTDGGRRAINNIYRGCRSMP